VLCCITIAADGIVTFRQSLAHSNPAQDDFQRAEIRERGLEQIETDKCREPKPVGVVVMRKHQTDENEYSGEPTDDLFHGIGYFRFK